MNTNELKQYPMEDLIKVKVSLKNLRNKLEEYIMDYGLDLYPFFKGKEIWKEEKQRAFIEYILNGGKSNLAIHLNCSFFGSIGKIDDYREGLLEMPMYCVDGVQRIKAILKFLDNDLAVFNGNYLKDLKNKEELINKFYIEFNINNLKTKNDTLNWHLELNKAI